MEGGLIRSYQIINLMNFLKLLRNMTSDGRKTRIVGAGTKTSDVPVRCGKTYPDGGSAALGSPVMCLLAETEYMCGLYVVRPI
jgi:hypothetical protein